MKMQNEVTRVFLIRIFLVVFFIMVFQNKTYARHRKKFKGIIIVNQVLKLDGTMTINGKLAPEYSGVKEGDILETNPNSFAIVRIVGLGIFRMGVSTKFKLRKISNRDESRFELMSGEVLSMFKRSGSHEFKLPHSDITLHETVFSAKAALTEDEINLDTGKIHVENLFASAQGTSSLPSGVSLNQPLPPKSDISKAELKAPPKGIVSVVPNVSAPTADSEKAEKESNARELTVSSEGTPKLIRVTSKGIEVNEEKNPPIPEFKYISDLESLYALP